MRKNKPVFREISTTTEQMPLPSGWGPHQPAERHTAGYITMLTARGLHKAGQQAALRRGPGNDSFNSRLNAILGTPDGTAWALAPTTMNVRTASGEFRPTVLPAQVHSSTGTYDRAFVVRGETAPSELPVTPPEDFLAEVHYIFDPVLALRGLVYCTVTSFAGDLPRQPEGPAAV